MHSVKAACRALTNAFSNRAFGDVIRIDPSTLAVVVDSRLDDVDARAVGSGLEIVPPDGLYEWSIRRDFVRSLPRGEAKRRLSETLAGPKTRRRFEVIVSASRDDDLLRAFTLFRHRRLRRYAARVVRFVLAGARSAAPVEMKSAAT